MSDAEDLKRAAAREAVALVERGMRLGLGTGSTVAHFLDLLGERIRSGEVTDVVGVPTSVHTRERCGELGIPVGELHDLAPLDLAVDGADEVDPSVDLVKGMGGALLREKMVAAQARRFVIIADERKAVRRLGEHSPVPVEVVPFAWQVHVPILREMGAEPTLRRDPSGEPVRTDNGNVILDCRFSSGLEDPAAVDARLRARPGIVETGFFLGMACRAYMAGAAGVRVISREAAS